jgi:hypothetical protein
VRNAVYRIYLEVCQDPDRFGISQDVIDLVKDGIESRKNKTNKKPLQLNNATETAMIDPKDLKGIVTQGRNKAAMLIHEKMDDLARHPKKLAKENIVSLAKVFGIFFDKSQIVQGEATEHVAVLAKVDDDMDPQDAIDALLQMRQKTMEDKYEGDESGKKG